MAEPKVQLVAPIGNITVPGMNVTGVVTATYGDVGVAGSIIQGNNLDIGTGIITATSFVGDQIGTYRAASLTGSPDLVVGVVTSSGFVAQITGDVTGNLTGNVVGTAGSILSGNNLHVGIATATLVGDGSNLTGVGGSSLTHQTVTANGAATSLDLSVGNIITFNQSADTTVSFANTSAAMKVTLIRVKDTGTTARTITWPDSVKWNGGSAPTLISNTVSGDSQQFQFLTRDSGLTWYAWEPYNRDVPSYSLFSWGNQDGKGALGQNNNTPQSSPMQIGTDVTWTKASVGNYYGNGGIKADGTLWTWGNNQQGNLAQNNKTSYSSPKQVGTDTNWASVNIDVCCFGVKTDGTLWAWGYNNGGGLGQNNKTQYSSPVQIPGTTWDSGTGKMCMSQNNARILAVRTDGTLWAVGHGDGGELGLNSTTQRSSPIQIPGTDWNQVWTNYHNTCWATTRST